MNKYTKQLKEELENCGTMPIFEIEVIDKTGEQEWINCDVFFRGNSIVAQRDAVTSKEAKSKLIAENSIIVDSCFGLDEHLHDLYCEITEAIIAGDLYELV